MNIQPTHIFVSAPRTFDHKISAVAKYFNVWLGT